MKKLITPDEIYDRESERTSDTIIDRSLHTAIRRCRNLFHHPLLSNRTQNAYADMLETLRMDGEVDMLEENVHYLRQTIKEVGEYSQQFDRSISEALSNHWISRDSASRWIRRFNDPNLIEFVRKQWVLEHLPALKKNWERVANLRQKIQREYDEELSQLTKNDVPDIKKFRSREMFLSLGFSPRENLVYDVGAACKAIRQDQRALYLECSRMLKGWANGKKRFLHPHKVGRWLNRIFSGSYSINARHDFVKNTLGAFKKEWVKLRCQMDTLEEEMNHHGIPQGFWVADVNTFLSWHADQRSAYIAEGYDRLSDQRSKHNALKQIKADIRHDIDSGDFEGAKILLKQAQKKHNNDTDLRSLERFCRYYDTTSTNAVPGHKEIQSTLQSMRDMIGTLPARIQSLYIRALKEGYTTFRALTVIMYNRVWLHRNGHMMTKDLELRECQNQKNRDLTRQYINNGHGEETEYNIIAGDTAIEGAIREDGTSTQIIYVNPEGEDAVLAHAHANRNNHDDNGFLYQTSLIPMGLDYSTHEQVVDHFHQPLKEGLRTLEQAGIPFTLS